MTDWRDVVSDSQYVDRVVLGEMPDIVERATAAGATPPLEYMGAGMTSVVLCHGPRSFKVARGLQPIRRSYLEDEADFFEAASDVTGVRKFVARFERFDAERLVIVKACARRDPDKRVDEAQLWDMHREIERHMLPHGWTAPEFKRDSYVVTSKGPVLVDGTSAHRVGRVLAQYVEDVLDGKRTAWTDRPSDLAFALRVEIGRTLTQAQVGPLERRLLAMPPSAPWGKVTPMPTATVAYEEAHKCKNSGACGCGAGGKGYRAEVGKSLAALGAGPELLGRPELQPYLERAEAMKLDPALAAATVFALGARGPQDIAVALERGGSRASAVARDGAKDYIAVTNMGRPASRRFTDYAEAKLAADKIGGYVKWASEVKASDCVGIHTHNPVDIPASLRAVAKASESGKTDLAAIREDGFNDGSYNSDMSHDTIVERVVLEHVDPKDEVAIRRLVQSEVGDYRAYLLEEIRQGDASGTYDQTLPLFIALKDEDPKTPRTPAERTALLDAYLQEFESGLQGRVRRTLERLADEREDYGGASDRLTHADRQALPASAFALPESRHLPLTNRLGHIDEGHVKAAAARLSMMLREGHITKRQHDEAHARIVRAGGRIGLSVSDAPTQASEGPHTVDLPPPERLLPYTKSLHWHREGEGVYYAQAGARGRFTLRQRTPNRRKGVLPWALLGPEGTEIGQADTKGDGQKLAAKILRQPPASLPPAGHASKAPDCIAIVERSPGCVPTGIKAETAAQVAAILRDRAVRLGHEEIGVVLVSVQQEMIGSPVVLASGQADGVHVSHAQIVGAAAKGADAGATSFWLWHLHPSGHHEPSPDDKRLTKKARANAQLIEMDFKGHLVVSASGHELA